jgi:hypothetical protein
LLFWLQASSRMCDGHKIFYGLKSAIACSRFICSGNIVKWSG